MQQLQDIVLITDPGSVDPDDIFSIIILSLLKNINIRGVIATHHYPLMRARLTKLLLTELGRVDIPVYQGNGVLYLTNLSDVDDEKKKSDKFRKENSKFPPFFGLPKGVKFPEEKQWFPNFMKGFIDEYGEKYLESLNIEEESGSNFLSKLLKTYSPENKLLVVCIAPMHDLVDIPTELYKNMDLWAMGGGFETITEGSISVPRAGYNWGICPEITQQVLDKLNESSTAVNLVSSEIVRKMRVNINIDTYNKWMDLFKSDTVPRLTKAIMQDWLYCNRGNKLTEHKNLCDPLTLMLALGKFDYSTIKLNTTINNIDNFKHYLAPIDPEKYMIVMECMENGDNNVNLITNFSSEITGNIIELLESCLFCNM